MPGKFGTSNSANGVFASTKASNHVGVFGSNEALIPPSGGGAGGAGVFGLSVCPGAAGVFGANNSTQGVGVQGNGPEAGVSGFSERGSGIRAHSNHANGIEGFAHDPNGNALLAINDAKTAPTVNDGSPHGCGVLSVTTVPGASGIFGANNSDQGVGVQGNGPEAGVSGFSKDGFGVVGRNETGFAAVHGHGGKNGMWGFSTSADDSGVFGQNDGKGSGVAGFSKEGDGVRANSEKSNGLSARSQTSVAIFARSESQTSPAVFAECDSQPAVIGTSKTSDGLRANSTDGNGLSARSLNGVGGFFQGGKLAAFFEGDITGTGHINIPKGTVRCFDMSLAAGSGDCAEEFDISGTEKIEPGTVMVLDPKGALQQSRQAYDKRVAGVISGAGDLRPGIVLDKQQSEGNRMPLALLGKVYCKVDAQYAPVEVGDLLTTSPTPGFAMKADSPLKAFGAVIGKALRPLTEGQGLIPILIALQ